LLGYCIGKGLSQKNSGPIGKRREGKGECPNRGKAVGGGGNSPKWRPVVRQGCKGETAPFYSLSLTCPGLFTG